MHHLVEELHADFTAKGGHVERVFRVLFHVPVVLGEVGAVELPEVQLFLACKSGLDLEVFGADDHAGVGH